MRIGDVSLIDLKTLKLSALGELKTINIAPGQLQIRLELIGPKTETPLFPEISPEKGKGVSPIMLSRHQQERLKHQIKYMQETIMNEQRQQVKENLSLDAQIYTEQFTELVKNARTGEILYEQFGKGLILAAYRSPKRSMYKRLYASDSKALPHNVDGVESYTLRIMKHGSKHNSIYIGSLFYSENNGPNFLFGTIPLFWWPVDPEIIRSIIFEEVIIFSIYNPAHLFERLECDGFEIEVVSPKHFLLRKHIGKSMIAFEHFDYFVSLIQHNLIPEDVVFNVVKASENKLLEKARELGNVSVRMDMIFAQKIRHIPAG